MDAPLLLGFPHFLLFCFVVGLHELGPGGVVARIDGEMMVFPVEVEGEHGEQVPGGQNDHEYLNPVHVLGLFGFFLVLVPRIEEGKDEGEVSPVEQDIVERVFTLGDLSVSTIMTLRDDIVWLDLEMTEEEIIKTIEGTIFEQYPVVDGDIDHVVGVLSIKDYVTALRRDKHLDLRKMMKEAHYVHENMSIYTVLEYMKSERIHRALVCDEFGGLEGIISLKDIFDALVGNMAPQELMKEPDIIARKDGDGWLVDGQCSIYDFLSHFDLGENMEDYDFSTVGGLLLENLQHVPKSGEKTEWQGFSFEVADMDGARIDKIIVKKLPDNIEKVTEE